MMDLREELGRIGGDLTASTVQQADLDLALGRRAVRRRRIAQAMGGSLAAVAAVAAISLSVNGGSSDGVVASPPAATAPSFSPRLVSYTGAQPEYFTVDWVPEGWFVQNSNSSGLIIAPDEAASGGPDVNPSAGPLYDPRNAKGKISVWLTNRSGEKLPPDLKIINIGGHQALLLKNERSEEAQPDGKLALEPVRPDGDYGADVVLLLPGNTSVEVHFWSGVGLSDQQMLQLAAGVHVSPKAKPGVG